MCTVAFHHYKINSYSPLHQELGKCRCRSPCDDLRNCKCKVIDLTSGEEVPLALASFMQYMEAHPNDNKTFVKAKHTQHGSCTFYLVFETEFPVEITLGDQLKLIATFVNVNAGQLGSLFAITRRQLNDFATENATVIRTFQSTLLYLVVYVLPGNLCQGEKGWSLGRSQKHIYGCHRSTIQPLSEAKDDPFYCHTKKKSSTKCGVTTVNYYQ